MIGTAELDGLDNTIYIEILKEEIFVKFLYEKARQNVLEAKKLKNMDTESRDRSKKNHGSTIWRDNVH